MKRYLFFNAKFGRFKRRARSIEQVIKNVYLEGETRNMELKMFGVSSDGNLQNQLRNEIIINFDCFKNVFCDFLAGITQEEKNNKTFKNHNNYNNIELNSNNNNNNYDNISLITLIINNQLKAMTQQ